MPLNDIPRPGSSLPRPSREQALALVGFLAISLVFLHEVIFVGRVFYRRDIHMWWLPRVETLVRCLHQGSWPLWDPWRAFGQPLLADPSSEVYYPLTWLNFILPPGASYALFVASHWLLSAAGAYALARRWGTSAGGAFVAAAIWMASPLVALITLAHHLAGAAWMPWVVYAAEAALAGGTVRRPVWCGVVMAVQILAGSADMVAMTWGLVALNVAVHHRHRRAVQSMTVAAGFALALSAAQWWPTLAAVTHTERLAHGETSRTAWSVHPLLFLEMLVPFQWLELPLKPTYLDSVLENRDAWLATLYLGLPTFSLAAAAFVPAARPRRALLLGVGVGACLVALGRHGPFYSILVTVVPPLTILRFPVKAMVLGALAWSMLAGFGWDAWRSDVSPGSRWSARVLPVVIGGSLLAVAAAFVAVVGWPIAPLLREGAGIPPATRLRILAGAMLAMAVLATALARARRVAVAAMSSTAVGALAVSSVVGAHLRLEGTVSAAAFRYRPEVLRWIPRGARIYVEDYSMRTRAEYERGVRKRMPYVLARLPVGASRGEGLMLGAHAYLNPPTAARWGIRGSYDLDALGLYDPWLARLTEALREREGTPAHLRLLQLGGVEYVLALEDPVDGPPLVPVAVVDGFFVEPVRVFRVPDTLPLAYGVGRAEIVTEAPASLERLTAPMFDARTTVLLADGTAGPASHQFRGTADVVLRKPDRLDIKTDFDAPGYLVLLEGYDAGWQATVDGRPAAVRRANMVFRAVSVPAGSHLVKLVYRPRAAVVGAALSGATGLVVALLLVWSSRSRPAA